MSNANVSLPKTSTVSSKETTARARSKAGPALKSPCQRCKRREAEIGAHGIRGELIYDEYFCEPCWSWKKKRQ